MTATWMLLLGVLAPVLTGLTSMALPRLAVTPRVLIALAGPALAFCLILGNLSLAGGEATATHASHDTHAVESTYHAAEPTAALAWLPSFHLNVAFLPDGLGGFFGLLVAGVGMLIVLYARGYFGNQSDAARNDLYRFYPTLGFFTTAMLGLVLADYTLLTLLFWELTSISSFLLIGWDREKPYSIQRALQAFVTTGLGGMFLLGGLALFGGVTGIWRWSELALHAGDVDWAAPLIVGSFLLMLVGAFAKSAQWPLHYWLPGAMAAPTPVSAFLHSATMVKAGVFLVGRLFPTFGGGGFENLGIETWAAVIIPFGTVTMLYGGITAVCKHDLKQIFAYTTVSQLGLLIAMYGLGGLTYTYHDHAYAALDFDITQIANHAFYKAPLFICAGAIGHVASRRLPELFGAIKQHPAICVTMLAAGWALAALPGSISFQAKELFLYAIYHAAESRPVLWLVMLATVLTAMCNVAIFVRLATTLLGVERFGLKAAPDHDHAEHHHEQEHGFAGALIWLPAVPLVALQFIGGIATPLWDALIGPFETNVYYPGFHGHVPSLLHVLMHPSVPLLCSGLGIALGVVLGLSPLLRHAHDDIHNQIYPTAASLTDALGRLALRVFQTGNVRHYTLATLAALLAGFTAAVIYDPGMWGALGAGLGTVTESWPGVFLGAVICVTAVMIPLTESRVVRVLILGACGFTVVAMYVLMQAPDLALTQLFFELISVLLFVLVLRMLPGEKPTKNPNAFVRITASVAIGLAVGWLTLVAAGANPTQRLGSYFIQNTYHGPALEDGGYAHGGGGFNIVNVILVDFRGFDTLGEICVLGLAALGVWSMMFGRGRGLPLRRGGQRNGEQQTTSDPTGKVRAGADPAPAEYKRTTDEVVQERGVTA